MSRAIRARLRVMERKVGIRCVVCNLTRAERVELGSRAMPCHNCEGRTFRVFEGGRG
jgi:Zn finger protein HypA/HybF involved in hydrogenase expression